MTKLTNRLKVQAGFKLEIKYDQMDCKKNVILIKLL